MDKQPSASTKKPAKKPVDKAAVVDQPPEKTDKKQDKKKQVSQLERHTRRAINNTVHVVDNTANVVDKVVVKREACVGCKAMHVLDRDKRCTNCAKIYVRNKQFIATPCAFRHCPDTECTRNATIKAHGRFFCTDECLKFYTKATEKANRMRSRGESEEAVNIMLNTRPVFRTERASDLFGLPDVQEAPPKQPKPPKPSKRSNNNTTNNNSGINSYSATDTTADGTTSSSTTTVNSDRK